MTWLSQLFPGRKVAYNPAMPIEPQEERLYTIKEAGEYLGLSRQRVHRLVQDGRIKAQRYGKIWLIPESALEDISPSTKRVGRPPKKKRRK